MSANKQLPHLLILPEDAANHEIATGFRLELETRTMRQVQVQPVAGGWNAVLDLFESEHIAEMDKYSTGFMALLIDFDGKNDRVSHVRSVIPERLRNRVLVLGVWTEPEDLHLGFPEQVGRDLAKDCRDGTNLTWGHDLLRHNASEIDRVRQAVLPILFPGLQLSALG